MTDLLHTAEALTEVPPAEPTADEVEGLNVESASPFRMAMRRFVHHRMAMICLVVFTIIVQGLTVERDLVDLTLLASTQGLAVSPVGKCTRRAAASAIPRGVDVTWRRQIR